MEKELDKAKKWDHRKKVVEMMTITNVWERKNEGAWIRLDNEQGKGDIDIFSPNNNNFCRSGVEGPVAVNFIK
jgi:hypothetical protein